MRHCFIVEIAFSSYVSCYTAHCMLFLSFHHLQALSVFVLVGSLYVKGVLHWYYYLCSCISTTKGSVTSEAPILKRSGLFVITLYSFNDINNTETKKETWKQRTLLVKAYIKTGSRWYTCVPTATYYFPNCYYYCRWMGFIIICNNSKRSGIVCNTTHMRSYKSEKENILLDVYKLSS